MWVYNKLREPSKLKPNWTKGEAYWGKQGFGGYPGVKHTAKKIVSHFPIKKFLVMNPRNEWGEVRIFSGKARSVP